MNKTSVLLLTALGVVFSACSSLPKLQTPPVLKTEYQDPTYKYCYAESCVKATKLSKEQYQPLEPDEPLIVPLVEEPKVEKKPVTKPKKQRRTYQKKRITKPKKKISHTPQCVMWK